jgi:hypothetical protein
MNIELRFLQKAIEDKNYVSFFHEGKSYKKVKPLKLELIENKYTFSANIGVFDFGTISKIKILKDRF